MAYWIPPALSARLIREPETGMGYQCVPVPGEEGRNSQDFFVILNAEIAVRASRSHFLDGRWRIYDQDLELLKNYASDVSTHYEIHLDPQFEVLNLVVENNLLDPFPHDGRMITVLPGNSYPTESRPREGFVRYSAFSDDKRITDDGKGLRPGTYVTTEIDASCVVSGQAAVSRYSLPNEAPAIFTTRWLWDHAFEITCGSVVPEFGRSGGGVEVRIDKPPPGGFQGRELVPVR